MSAKRIYIQIQTADRVGPDSLIAAVKRAYALLRELDSSITQDPQGHVNWEIETIRKTSPLVFSFVGTPKRNLSDPTAIIQKELTTGLRKLPKEKERPTRYSDRYLKSLQEFGELQHRKDLGPIGVYTSPTAQKVAVSEKVVTRIGVWLEATDESFGSIVGSLDSITVHRSNEFRVWDEVNNKPVTCNFDHELLPLVKKYLKHRVMVSGAIKRNVQGLPVKIRVRDLTPMKDESELPQIEEMSGLVDDFTEGKSISQFLEELRGER